MAKMRFCISLANNEFV